MKNLESLWIDIKLVLSDAHQKAILPETHNIIDFIEKNVAQLIEDAEEDEASSIK